MTATGLTLVEKNIQQIDADTKKKFESLDDSIAGINTTINTTTEGLNSKITEITAITQGKSTNYYSETDPSEQYTIKEGDC
jgi:hypothetical protein